MLFCSVEETMGCHFDRSEPLALSEVEGLANGVEKSGLVLKLYTDFSIRLWLVKTTLLIMAQMRSGNVLSALGQFGRAPLSLRQSEWGGPLSDERQENNGRSEAIFAAWDT